MRRSLRSDISHRDFVEHQLIAAASGVAARQNKPEENKIIVWDCKTGAVVFTQRAGSRWQEAITFTPDDRYLISAGGGNDPDWSGHEKDADCSIRVWDFRRSKLMAKLEGHEATVRALAVLPDGKHLVSCACDQTIRLWRLPD